MILMRGCGTNLDENPQNPWEAPVRHVVDDDARKRPNEPRPRLCSP
jgi:hypothetical protein